MVQYILSRVQRSFKVPYLYVRKNAPTVVNMGSSTRRRGRAILRTPRRRTLRCISRQRLNRLRDQKAPHPRRLLSLPTKPKARFIRRLLIITPWPWPHIRHKRGWRTSHFHNGANINAAYVRRDRALRVFLPGRHRSLRLGAFSEYKANKDVQAPNGEEEKGRDEGERVHAMGEDRSSDPMLQKKRM